MTFAYTFQNTNLITNLYALLHFWVPNSFDTLNAYTEFWNPAFPYSTFNRQPNSTPMLFTGIRSSAHAPIGTTRNIESPPLTCLNKKLSQFLGQQTQQINIQASYTNLCFYFEKINMEQLIEQHLAHVCLREVNSREERFAEKYWSGKYFHEFS